MENLSTALEGLELSDLQATKPAKTSNLIEPTVEEIRAIITALKDGVSYKDIKKTIRRDVDGAKLGFSYGQLKEIDLGRQAKIAELKEPEVIEL